MLLTRDCAAQKSKAANLQFSHRIAALCYVREDLALLIADLNFPGQRPLFQLKREPPCSYCFACLGSYRNSLFHRTGATIEAVIARCTGCSSKLCWPFGTFWIGPLHQSWLQAKEWSREVGGGHHCSRAKGQWELVLIDFRNWPRQPSRRWCLSESLSCYFTEILVTGTRQTGSSSP